MDEAGYGPNLGPLVLTATVWETPSRPRLPDFWSAFAEVVTQTATDGDPRLHISDSKEVYSPARGLGALERGVLAALGITSRVPSRFHELLDDVQGRSAVDPAADDGWAHALWFNDVDLPLPLTEAGMIAETIVETWRGACTKKKIRLRAICSDIVAPRRWNRATRAVDNKATALSKLHLQLLRRVWDPDTDGPTLILADKHGGRNRYAALLTECLDGQMVLCGRESRESSIYRIGRSEIRFEARCERYFPVALASMVSKYVRELTMELFNRFWCTHLPQLKPTHGYPTDAHRFRRDVAEVQSRLAIPDEVFWRER
jgi:hypothetical protein